MQCSHSVPDLFLLSQYFQEHNVPIHFHTIQADEQNKDFDQVFGLAAAMHEFSINRYRTGLTSDRTQDLTQSSLPRSAYASYGMGFCGSNQRLQVAFAAD